MHLANCNGTICGCTALEAPEWMLGRYVVYVLLGSHQVLELFHISEFPLPAQLLRAMAVVHVPLDCVLITLSHSPVSQIG